LEAIGAAEMPIVLQDLFEELPVAVRVIEDLGAVHLDLQEGELVPELDGLIAERQRQRQARDPAIKEGLDVIRPEPIVAGLQRSGIGTGGDPLSSALRATR
jgi:hypothetical protein